LSIWNQLKDRVATLLEVAQTVDALKLVDYEPAAVVWKKSTPSQTAVVLTELMTYLQTIPEAQYTAEDLESPLLAWIAERGYGNGDVLWPMRFALSGLPQSPPPFELAALLGKSETIQRLQQAQQAVAGLVAATD
jgi:glutamyl-tRNA synthetase